MITTETTTATATFVMTVAGTRMMAADRADMARAEVQIEGFEVWHNGQIQDPAKHTLPRIKSAVLGTYIGEEGGRHFYHIAREW